MTRPKKKPVVGAVIQARLGSSRLPGKVLLPLAGKPVLAHVVERLRRCRRLDRIVVATSTAPEDARLLKLADELGVDSFAGSENDVLSRFLGAADRFSLDIVVRICSDSPLLDWVFIDEMIARLAAGRADYSICDESLRHGCEGFETVTAAALRRVAALTDDAVNHEHVTWYIRRHPDEFRIWHHPVPREMQGPYRMSMDVAADYEFMRRIYEALYRPGNPIDLRAALRWLKRHPEVMAHNAHVRQKPAEDATRRMLFILGGGIAAGRRKTRLAAVTAQLAENHHVVLTLAAPAPIAALADFGARGYRLLELPAKVRLTRAVVSELAERCRVRLLVYDEALPFGDNLVAWLAGQGITALPLATRIDRLAKLARAAAQK